MASAAPSADSASNGALFGTIIWEIDIASISTTAIYSSEVEVGGIQWALCVVRHRLFMDRLEIFLYEIEGDYEVESVDATYAIKLINHDDDSKSISGEYRELFVNIDNWGIAELINWSDVIDVDKGFLKNNKLTVQCVFSLWNIVGYKGPGRIDFTDSNEPSQNVALVIEGEKVYACKQFLSIHSSVFRSMFFGQFVEKDKNEIELKDVNHKEFIELLHVIYPPYKKITDHNVEYLLKLADCFDIKVVVTQCEQYLITAPRFSIAEKLLHACRYRLTKLQSICLNNLKTTKDVKNLKNSDSYKGFTDELHLALYHKMMSMSD